MKLTQATTKRPAIPRKTMEFIPEEIFAPGFPICQPARSQGFTMIEAVAGIAILSMILLGIMATFSTGFIAQRDNSEISENQFLTRQVLEEMQDIGFDFLLSFDGTGMVSPNGKNRATITATDMGADLVRIQVVSSSLDRPEITSRAITLISDPN